MTIEELKMPSNSALCSKGPNAAAIFVPGSYIRTFRQSEYVFCRLIMASNLVLWVYIDNFLLSYVVYEQRFWILAPFSGSVTSDNIRLVSIAGLLTAKIYVICFYKENLKVQSFEPWSYIYILYRFICSIIGRNR